MKETAEDVFAMLYVEDEEEDEEEEEEDEMQGDYDDMLLSWFNMGKDLYREETK